MSTSANCPGLVAIPPSASWGGVLSHNLSRPVSLLLGVRREEIRAQLVEAARAHTEKLVVEAGQRGIPVPRCQTPPALGAPIVMTGHQPVLYHPGLLFKEQMLMSFAGAASALPMSVTIDLDQGDGGSFLAPCIHDGALLLRQRSVAAQGGGMFRDQHVADEGRLREIFGQVSADLEASSLFHLVAPVRGVADLYLRLQGMPIPQAHSIARRAICGHSHLEIPLSGLIELPAARAFLAAIVSAGRGFSEAYNSALDAYRAAHRIRNAANPFPNMKLAAESWELPLWRFGREGRLPVFGPGETGTVGSIAPRGSIVTLLLRGLCSDLFIHGLGGGTYDPFVSDFARSFLSQELPSFVVASRTRHLFPARVAELERDLEMRSRLREVVSHPRRFLGQQLFTAAEERRIVAAAAEREGLIGQLHSAESDAQRSSISHELNEINRALRGVLQETGLYRRLHAQDVTQAALDRWRCRELPFFFFDCGTP